MPNCRLQNISLWKNEREDSEWMTVSILFLWRWGLAIATYNCGKKRLNPFFRLHEASEVLNKYVMGRPLATGRGIRGWFLPKFFCGPPNFVMPRTFLRRKIEKKHCSRKCILPPPNLKPGYGPGNEVCGQVTSPLPFSLVSLWLLLFLISRELRVK